MDTTTRKQLLQSFGSAPEQLEKALKEIDAQIWSWNPAPKEWSISQIIFHITDSEANYYVRFRQAIAQTGGAVVGFDQDKWTESLAYPGRGTEEALQLFRLLRTSSHRLLAQLPEKTWTNTVQHSERGTLTLDNLLTTAENHIREHLQQFEGNVNQYKSR